MGVSYHQLKCLQPEVRTNGHQLLISFFFHRKLKLNFFRPHAAKDGDNDPEEEDDDKGD
jgi:hypothetical protein